MLENLISQDLVITESNFESLIENHAAHLDYIGAELARLKMELNQKEKIELPKLKAEINQRTQRESGSDKKLTERVLDEERHLDPVWQAARNEVTALQYKIDRLQARFDALNKMGFNLQYIGDKKNIILNKGVPNNL